MSERPKGEPGHLEQLHPERDADDADADTGLDTDIDNDGDIETELDGGLRLFSFRGIIAFLTVLGWVGILGVRLEWALAAVISVSLISSDTVTVTATF